MINELTLKNFKSWKRIKRMRLAPITGLFGENSSGKSSILQALLLLKQTIESSDRSQPLVLGGEKDYVELGTFKDVVWNHDEGKALSFELAWDLPEKLAIRNPEEPTETLFSGDTMGFATEIDLAAKGQARVRRMAYMFDGKTFSFGQEEIGNPYKLSPTKQGSHFRFVRTQGRKWELPKPVKFYGFPDQVMTYYQNTDFLADIQAELERLFSRTYYLGPLREFPKRRYLWSGSEPDDVGQRGERAIDAILAARGKGDYIRRGRGKPKMSLDKMLAHQLKRLRLIHSFSVKQIAESSLYEVHVKKHAAAPDVLITDVGFGVSQVLPVLTLCYFVPEGSTILIEQPEIHLHPSVQSGLADVFIDVAKDRNIQLIIESHSEHLLNRLQRRIAEEIITPKDVALYFCRAEQESGAMDRLKTNLFGDIENWPKDFFGDQFGEMAAKQQAALRRQIEGENAE